MERQSTRRTVLGKVAASGTAALLGTYGGRTFAATRESRRNTGSEGTPVSGDTQEDGAVALQTNEQLKELWGRWAELWNGDLAVADEIIAPRFVAHFAPVGNSPSEVRGPDGLQGWISLLMSAFTDYSVATTVGPLADGDKLAGRWVIRGKYQGGIPGSSPAAIGKQIEFEGMDLLRVEGGQIVEYWVSSDTLDFQQQLGVIPS